MQNIGIDLINRPPFDDRLNSESVIPMNAPINLVDLLIEGLAINQPDELRFKANKQFSQQTILKIKLPVALPISFLTPNDKDKTQLGFYETNLLDANNSQEQVKTVLNTMAEREKIVYQITNVTPESFSNNELEEFTKECNVIVLKDNEQKGPNELVSFTLDVLKYDFDQNKENK